MKIKVFKLKNLFLFITVLEIILMIAVVFCLEINISLKEQLSSEEYQRFMMNQAADELRQSSDDLTRFARTYTITGDKTYKQNFYRVLDIREGRVPKPRNYDSIYWDYREPLRSRLHPDEEPVALAVMMNQLPYNPEEREKLRISKQNSDDLVNLEEEAFHAMDGIFKDQEGNYTIKGEPDQQLAIKLVYSDAYFLAKQKIMQPIDEFLIMLNARTLRAVTQLRTASKTNSTLLVIIVSIFIAVNIIIFIILHRRIIRVILRIIREVKHHSRKIFNFYPISPGSDDELGILIDEFNTLQTAIVERTNRLECLNYRIMEQRTVIDNYVIISETDLNGDITYVSEAFCKISGYSKEELLGVNHRIVRHPDMPVELFTDLWWPISGGDGWHGQIKNLTKMGEPYWVDIVIEPILDRQGRKTGYRSIQIDITDKKQIEVLSVTDKLTGLYNRLKLDDVFKYEIMQAERYNNAFSIILINIDKFKNVNDMYGHQAGDQILQSFSTLLRENIRAADTAGRWGGEEFLILCPETNLKSAVSLAEKLRQKIETHIFPFIGHKTASFGLATYQTNDTEKHMVSRADSALYQAKKNGRNLVVAGNC